MEIKKRTMSRAGWARLQKSAYCAAPLNLPSLKGAAGLIRMDEVTAPLSVISGGKPLVIADAGCAWLQIAPERENWWLSVMLNPVRRITQYYFDITRANVILPKGNSYFFDLFLDVVLTPEGEISLLDADELDQALHEGAIDRSLYSLAWQEAERLMNALPGRREDLFQFCLSQYRRLEKLLPPSAETP